VVLGWGEAELGLSIPVRTEDKRSYGLSVGDSPGSASSSLYSESSRNTHGER